MDSGYAFWKERLEGTPDGDEIDKMGAEEAADAFCGDLSFGTGGLRGIMGMGTNRINRHTVERVTHGLAKTILSKPGHPKSVGVAYDVRHNSADFAETVCEVLSAHGIAVYIFDKPMPTPALSFAIRRMKLGWGVVITASHNPREYNGYKVYDGNGVQLTDGMAAEVTAAIGTVQCFEPMPEGKEAQIRIFGPDVEAEYLEQIAAYALTACRPPSFDTGPAGVLDGLVAKGGSGNTKHEEKGDLQKAPADNRTGSNDSDMLSDILQKGPANTKQAFVYSALHGTGAAAIPQVLEKLGFAPICIQQEPDGDFGGMATPNPEEPDVYAMAMEEADKTGARLLMATDPDCDRVGVMEKAGNGFKMLSGNQIGALLIDYLAQTKGVTPGDTVITTIVSGLLGELVAKSYGLEFVRLLTGFKYIGEHAERLAEGKRFFFGYEESYGFLAGDGARDKDAVIAAALIAQMAEHYDSLGLTLLDRWDELSGKHGYCIEALHGAAIAPARLKEIMEAMRCGPDISGIARTEDYLNGLHGLPKSDVIKFYFDDGGWAAIRPSGTEPKIKLYAGTYAKTRKEAEASLESITGKLLPMFEI